MNNYDNIIETINENEGELTQLSIIVKLLNNLRSWCVSCFNTEQEQEDYKKLEQAQQLLNEVLENYRTKY